MDLSNLRPADGAKQSDNFRRGRGHGSETVRQPVKVIKVRKLVQAAQDRALKVDRCLITKNTEKRVYEQKL